jgi:hypothetical protein
LNDAYLDNADLTYGDFRGVKNLDLDAVKGARNWDRAFYGRNELEDKLDSAFHHTNGPDPDPRETLKTLTVLGLPRDHNIKLAEQQKKEERIQKKQNARQTASKPPSPKEN